MFSGMLNYLLRIVRPPQFDDAEKTQTATQLHYTLFMGVGIAGGIAALILAVDNTYSVWTPAIPAITAGLLAALLFVLRAGYVRTVSARNNHYRLHWYHPIGNTQRGYSRFGDVRSPALIDFGECLSW